MKSFRKDFPVQRLLPGAQELCLGLTVCFELMTQFASHWNLSLRWEAPESGNKEAQVYVSCVLSAQ